MFKTDMVTEESLFEGNLHKTKIESPPFYFFLHFRGVNCFETESRILKAILHLSLSSLPTPVKRRRKSDVSDRELACLGRKHLYEIEEGRANSFEEEIPPRPSSNKEKSPSFG